MGFSLPDFAIRRPITVIMIVITCVGLGIIAARRISIEFMPPMDLPFLGAFIPYIGANPEQVENEIAIPAEGEFQTLTDLQSLRTSSTGQGCFVGMRFDWGADMSEALAEVRDRMERLRLVLPDDVDRIYVRHFSLETIPIMQLGLATEGDYAVFADKVRNELVPKLKRLPGVAEIELFGTDAATVMVDLDQQSLLSHGVSIYELIGKLRVSNVSMGVGDVIDGDRKYHVRAESELERIEDYSSLQLRPELRLGDVAKGTMRSREQERRFSIDGEQQMFLMVTKESEANTAATCSSVVEEMDRLLKTPDFAGASYFLFFSQGDVISGALSGLRHSSVFGGAMAILVLFLFMGRIRPTLVVATAIPGSILSALVVMYALGMSLNLVTMMSLIIAVGMVVDDAIVVIENIFRHRDLGADPVTAARRGSEEVGLAIFASTVSSSVVFIPVFYIDSGQMSVFTRQFAVPVTIAVAASLVIALTVTPLAASRFRHHENSWMERWRSRRAAASASDSRRHYFNWFVRSRQAYGAILAWTLQQRLAAVLIVIAIGGLTLAVPVRNVGFQSLPSADRRYVDIRFDFDPNYDMDRAQALFDKLRERVDARRGELGIKHVFENFDAREGEMRLYLVNEEDVGPTVPFPYSSDEVKSIMAELLPASFPGGSLHLSTGIEDAEMGNLAAQVSLRIEGNDTEILRHEAERLISELETLPGVTEATTDAQRAEPELQIKIDPQLAGIAGVNPTAAAQTVAFALLGTKLSTIKRDGREIEVWSQFEEMDRAGLGNLENIRVQGGEGRSVPLNEIIQVSRGHTPQMINRRDGKNYIWVQAHVTTENLRSISDELAGVVSRFELPPGYRIVMGDEMQGMEDDMKSFVSILLMAIVLIYIVMAALFESYVLPLSILTTVPISFLGVYWLMYLTGAPMDTVAFIGCILMVGVVVKNGIVIVDRINQLRIDGAERTDAILRAGHDRLRPVIMTALTTILGSVPLAIGGRLGEPAAVGLGRAMIGGLITGTVLTLFVVPLFYTLIDDFRGWSIRFAADLFGRRVKPGAETATRPASS